MELDNPLPPSPTAVALTNASAPEQSSTSSTDNPSLVTVKKRLVGKRLIKLESSEDEDDGRSRKQAELQTAGLISQSDDVEKSLRLSELLDECEDHSRSEAELERLRKKKTALMRRFGAGFCQSRSRQVTSDEENNKEHQADQEPVDFSRPVNIIMTRSRTKQQHHRQCTQTPSSPDVDPDSDTEEDQPLAEFENPEDDPADDDFVVLSPSTNNETDREEEGQDAIVLPTHSLDQIVSSLRREDDQEQVYRELCRTDSDPWRVQNAASRLLSEQGGGGSKRQRVVNVCLSIPVRLPLEVVVHRKPLSSQYAAFVDNDPASVRQYKEAQCSDDHWTTSSLPFYKQLRDQIHSIAFGTAGNAAHSRSILSLITANRLKFYDELPIPSTAEDVCDGCNFHHRVLSYVFWELNDEGKLKEPVLRMGRHCGEKVKSLVNLIRLLNCMRFVEYDEDIATRLQAMIGYWSDHLLSVNQGYWGGDEQEADIVVVSTTTTTTTSNTREATVSTSVSR